MCSAYAGGKIKCHSVKGNRILSPIKSLRGYTVSSMAKNFAHPGFTLLQGDIKGHLKSMLRTQLIHQGKS